MSEQQDERKRDPIDPREDLIAVVADARGPVSVEIMFTREELEQMVALLYFTLPELAAPEHDLIQGALVKLRKLLDGGAR